jgi:hypothetical protein
MNLCGELLWWTAMANSYRLLRWSILNFFYSLGNPLLDCSLPCYMHFYRPLLSCNNTPLFRLPMLPCLQNSWENFSCIRGYIILSVAWQWVFTALGNSAFQTTCHSIFSFHSFTWLYKYKEEYKQGEMWHSAQGAKIFKEICMFQSGRCQATGTWLFSAETNKEKLSISRQRFRNHGYIDGNNWSRDN